MNDLYYIIFGVFLFILGGLGSFLIFEIIQTPNIGWQSVNIYDDPHTFFGIFSNNLLIGILVSLGGYLCGGLLDTPALPVFDNPFLKQCGLNKVHGAIV